MPNGPKVTVEIGAQTQAFAAGANQVKSKLNELGQSFQSGPLSQLGTFLVSPMAAASAAASTLVAAIRNAISYAEHLRDLASKIDTTPKNAARFERAANVVGLSPSVMEQTIGRMRESIGGALGGSPDPVKAFSALGISLEDLASQSSVDLFERIIDKFKDGAGSAREFSAANQILGRSFDELLPAISRGFGGELKKDSMFALTSGQIEALERKGGFFRRLWEGSKNLGVGTVAMGSDVVGEAWRHLKIGLQLPGAAIGLGSEGIEDLQADELIHRGYYNSGVDPDRLPTRLKQGQERRRIMAAMREANRFAALGMEFDALPIESRLAYLSRLQTGAMESIKSQSPFEREATIKGLLRLTEDLVKLQSEQTKQLDAIQRGIDRGVQALDEGL